MTVVFATQIKLDSQGVAWIGGTKMKVTEIVLDKVAYGWSPEEIHFQHPALSLAQIHAALTSTARTRATSTRRSGGAGGCRHARVSDAAFRRGLSDLKRSL